IYGDLTREAFIDTEIVVETVKAFVFLNLIKVLSVLQKGGACIEAHVFTSAVEVIFSVAEFGCRKNIHFVYACSRVRVGFIYKAVLVNSLYVFAAISL